MESANRRKRESSSSLPSSSVVFTCSENTLSEGLNQLRQKQEMIDLHVKSGKQLLPAHRFVLMNSCPMLSRMLSKEWDPDRKDICELGEDVVHPDIGEDLLGFLYTRRVVITMENAKLLCIAANYLETPTLKAATEQYLCDHLQLSTTNVLDWFNFAQLIQLESLSKCCTMFVFESYDFPEDDRLVELPSGFLLHLFKDLQEPVSNMIINDGMFKLLVKWVNFDLPARSDSLFELFEAIPLLDLSENFFKNTVCKEKIILDSSECSGLIEDALNQLSLDSQPTSTEGTPKQHFYCFGGYRFREGDKLGSVSHLDVSTGEWTDMAPMTNPKRDFSITAIGHKVYIFGGTLRSTKKDTNSAEVFDTKRNRWTELQPMPNSGEPSSAVAVKDFIYVCQRNMSIDRYCVLTNEWVSLGPIWGPQYGFQLIAYKDIIYATNGRDVIKFDPKSNRRGSVALEDTSSLGYSPFAAHQNKFYQFKGTNVTVYDPETNTRKTLALRDSMIGDYYVSSGDKIWGMKYIHATGVVEFREYDPATVSWKMLDIKNDGRIAFKAALIKR